MNEVKKERISKEIEEYINILSNPVLLSVLQEETLIELHRVLGIAVSLIQHMQEGED